ncbi:MAG: helix-turn-helix domain-containing protein [Haloarculaceae archaeon]
MSQTPLPLVVPTLRERTAENTIEVESDRVARDVLTALDDTDCRCILNETSTDAKSAKELSETCDLPLSTAYRKVDLLSDVGLLDERTRISRTGKHASEYTRRVDEVTVTIDDDGRLHVSIARREADHETSPLATTVQN